jgi:hypothetical protein
MLPASAAVCTTHGQLRAGYLRHVTSRFQPDVNGSLKGPTILFRPKPGNGASPLAHEGNGASAGQPENGAKAGQHGNGAKAGQPGNGAKAHQPGNGSNAGQPQNGVYSGASGNGSKAENGAKADQPGIGAKAESRS